MAQPAVLAWANGRGQAAEDGGCSGKVGIRVSLSREMETFGLGGRGLVRRPSRNQVAWAGEPSSGLVSGLVFVLGACVAEFASGRVGCAHRVLRQRNGSGGHSPPYVL